MLHFMVFVKSIVSFVPLSGDVQDGGALDEALAEQVQGLVGSLQRKRLYFGSDGHLGSQGQEFFAILPGEVGYRADHSFTPKDVIGKRGDIAHVDAAADYHAAFGRGS